MVRIQKRLDVIIALTGESLSDYRDAAQEGIEGLVNGIEHKLEGVKTAIQTKPGEYLGEIKEELLELRTKFAVNMELRKGLSALKDFFQKDMIRSNPGMTSMKYKEELEELKEKSSGKKEK